MTRPILATRRGASTPSQPKGSDMSDHDPTEPPPRDPCGAARPVLLPVPEDYAPPVALVFGADGLAAAPRPVAIVVPLREMPGRMAKA